MAARKKINTQMTKWSCLKDETTSVKGDKCIEIVMYVKYFSKSKQTRASIEDELFFKSQ